MLRYPAPTIRYLDVVFAIVSSTVSASPETIDEIQHRKSQ